MRLDRYKRVLLAKRGELSVKTGDGESSVPAARGGMVVLPTRPPPMPKRSYKSACIKPTVASLERVEAALSRIRQSTLGICEVCHQPISVARLQGARTPVKA
jgi:hypothetical protein